MLYCATAPAAGNRDFGDVGCAAFWEVFERNPVLRLLDLCGCGMTDSSAKVLVENMPFSRSLQHLDFSFNYVRAPLPVCVRL